MTRLYGLARRHIVEPTKLIYGEPVFRGDSVEILPPANHVNAAFIRVDRFLCYTPRFLGSFRYQRHSILQHPKPLIHPIDSLDKEFDRCIRIPWDCSKVFAFFWSVGITGSTFSIRMSLLSRRSILVLIAVRSFFESSLLVPEKRAMRMTKSSIAAPTRITIRLWDKNSRNGLRCMVVSSWGEYPCVH